MKPEHAIEEAELQNAIQAWEDSEIEAQFVVHDAHMCGGLAEGCFLCQDKTRFEEVCYD